MKRQYSARFKDGSCSRYYYWNEFYVHCPKCEGRAIVRKNERGNYGEAKLSCPNCHHRQDQPLVYYNMSVKCFCSNCAEPVRLLIENVSTKKAYVSVKCPACQLTQRYQPRYEKLLANPYASHLPTDPFFSLPLWLCGTFKGKIFWAYNYEHLVHIRQYVGAALRIKSAWTHRTMLQKLPAWIVAAKHRPAILKMISRLERK